MKKRNPIYTAGSFLLAGALTLSMAACSGAQAPAEATQTPSATATPAAAAAPAEETTPSAPESDALPVKALQPKQVEENPYMAKSDANIHHDGYNTDSTDEILPLGIYPEIHVSYETTNANASPAIYFDSYGHAVVPLLGGIAIRDLNAEETKTLGYFSPKQHDGGSYLIQSSYTFLDAENRIVCPTSNNHVLMLRATDEEGNVLPEFEKVLDIDIKAAAEAALGKELTQNLLSVVFDYDGNLWFATGGFRIYPERQQQGVLGYIAHSAIEAILNGEQTDLSKAVFVYELTPGEGAENGIAASKDGAVILTNKNCYLLRANNGVEAVWCTPYESVGAKVSGEGDKTTGGGLAWGGGCSPTLTPNLVMFTDNADPVNLLALDMKTGEVVAKTPVLDDLPDGYQVAIENSAIVYDDGAGTVSTIVCNWFGAGNAGLADPGQVVHAGRQPWCWDAHCGWSRYCASLQPYLRQAVLRKLFLRGHISPPDRDRLRRPEARAGRCGPQAEQLQIAGGAVECISAVAGVHANGHIIVAVLVDTSHQRQSRRFQSRE